MPSVKKVIYIDGTPLVRSPFSGIGHYTRELIQAMAHSAPGHHIIILLFSDDKPEASAMPARITVERLPLHRKLISGYSKMVHTLNVRRLLKHTPNWVIYPSFSMFPYIHGRGIRTIAVVHDLAYLRFPETIEPKNLTYLQKMVPQTIKCADYIACPSRFSRHDVLSYFSDAVPDNVFVAEPAYKKTTYVVNHTRPDLRSLCESDYLLFISTIEPRKNIERLIASVSAMHNAGIHYNLIIAGKQGWGSVKIDNKPYIHYVGQISNQERSYLLDSCQAFVFPSLFEGFGMPVLEAVAHNKPVISSDNSSLGEIISPQVAYVIKNPQSVSSITAAINQFHHDHIHSPNKILQKIARYDKVLSTYTWAHTAEAFLTVIDTPESTL